MGSRRALRPAAGGDESLTQNIAAIPFLWVLPLSLYLLSFILCFDSDRWYNRWLFTRLAGFVALPGMAYAISNEDIRDQFDNFSNKIHVPALKHAVAAVSNISDMNMALAFFCAALFVLFMVFTASGEKKARARLSDIVLSHGFGGRRDRRIADRVRRALLPERPL